MEYIDTGVKHRWKAVISYHGGLDVTHYINEISDLQMLVERGPNFYLIDSISIVPNPDRDGYDACRADAEANSDIPTFKGVA